MKTFLVFLLVFALVYLVHLIYLLGARKNRFNKVPAEVNIFLIQLELDHTKLNMLRFCNVISLVTAIDIGIIFISIYKMYNIWNQLLIGIAIMIPIILISYYLLKYIISKYLDFFIDKRTLKFVEKYKEDNKLKTFNYREKYLLGINYKDCKKNYSLIKNNKKNSYIYLNKVTDSLPNKGDILVLTDYLDNPKFLVKVTNKSVITYKSIDEKLVKKLGYSSYNKFDKEYKKYINKKLGFFNNNEVVTILEFEKLR